MKRIAMLGAAALVALLGTGRVAVAAEPTDEQKAQMQQMQDEHQKAVDAQQEKIKAKHAADVDAQKAKVQQQHQANAEAQKAKVQEQQKARAAGEVQKPNDAAEDEDDAE